MEQRVMEAKLNKKEAESLLKDYLPFIKKQVAMLSNYQLEFDDMQSIAMITFLSCIQQYQAGQGTFLEFTKHCIRNRIIDELRKQNRYTTRVIPFSKEDSEEEIEVQFEAAAVEEYSKEIERQNISDEISELSTELECYGITFRELAKICPRQDRSRNLCLFLAKEVSETEEYKKKLSLFRRLPKTELAKRFQISEKTIEKHRKYIVTLVVLLLGDYPGIKTFLPQYKGVD